MTSSLETDARELIRQYRMNHASLRLIQRLDCALDVEAASGGDTDSCNLFREHSKEILQQFASLKELESRLQAEAARLYGAVRSPDEAAARYTQVLKIIGGG